VSQARTARTRRIAGTRRAVVASIAVAALAHASLAGVASATDLLSGWSFGARAAQARPGEASGAPRPPLSPSCDGDALLAVGARSLLCVSPFIDDRQACVTELGNRLESDRLRCHLDQLEAALVSITPIDVDKIPQIDPEMLLEDPVVKPEDVPPPPPPELMTVAAPPPPPPPPPSRTRPEQIVETAQPETTEPPPDTRLLSERNTRVERQTVARGAVKEPMIARPSPEQLAIKPDAAPPGSTKPPDQVGQREDAPRTPGKLSMRAPGPVRPSEAAEPAKLAGPLDGVAGPRGDGDRIARGNALFTARARERAPEVGQGGGGGGSKAIPDLRPTADALERVAGGGSVDYLDDVADGDETALNSKGSVYAVFFNRLKRRVAEVWAPSPLWERNDPSMQIYGQKDRTTRVRVTLTPMGELLKIIVLDPSGVPFLDEEAMRAFRVAQPFPNPPAGLVDASGAITFTFGFHIQMGRPRVSWQYRGL
jgi:TonB family protein